jgi:Pyruvate/2-oxoacid:ferredoxin oxidoreductase delta subunit
MERKPNKSIIQPSTSRFFQEGRRLPGYSLYDWLHGYVYARWIYLYIGIGTGEHPIAKNLRPVVDWFSGLFHLVLVDEKGSKENCKPTTEDETGGDNEQVIFAEGYHGKVVPLESAKQLVTVNEEINLPNLEQVIPYQQARDLVLQNPDHIVVLECPCRVSRPEPCLPLDVCLIVGEPFASFVNEHHPDRSRWISPNEAVEILQAEDERGHVHHAFFKDAMLGRFYAICNCCSCCCGAMHAHRNGTPMLASSGYVTRVDEDLCIGCGDCLDYCQFGALSLMDIVVSIDMDACMGCGVCGDKCEQDALSLYREASKGEPLDLCELMSNANELTRTC